MCFKSMWIFKLYFVSQVGLKCFLADNLNPLEASLPDQGKKKQRNKRAPKIGAEKPQSRWKKRKKEQEEQQVVYQTTDTLMTQLKQVSVKLSLNNQHLPNSHLFGTAIHY